MDRTLEVTFESYPTCKQCGQEFLGRVDAVDLGELCLECELKKSEGVS